MIRSAADAFGAVPEASIAASIAIGYSPWRRFWGVELPIAVPVIVAGLRVVSVSTVSLATIGSLTGIPSLGTLFTDGFQRGIVAEVVTGILATVALGLLLDGACALAGRATTRWERASTTGPAQGGGAA
jgi:osmoprotectant transport system permease protein